MFHVLHFCGYRMAMNRGSVFDTTDLNSVADDWLRDLLSTCASETVLGLNCMRLLGPDCVCLGVPKCAMQLRGP